MCGLTKHATSGSFACIISLSLSILQGENGRIFCLDTKLKIYFRFSADTVSAKFVNLRTIIIFTELCPSIPLSADLDVISRSSGGLRKVKLLIAQIPAEAYFQT